MLKKRKIQKYQGIAVKRKRKLPFLMNTKKHTIKRKIEKLKKERQFFNFFLTHLKVTKIKV